MIVGETGNLQQSIEDIPRNNCIKIPRTTCCASGVFHRILQSFRTNTFENNFGGLLLKRKQEEKGGFQVLTFSRAVIHKS